MEGCGHDNTDIINISEEYIDDLNLLELIFMADLLIHYNFPAHVGSDVGIDQRFLPPSTTQTQSYNNGVAQLTRRT